MATVIEQCVDRLEEAHQAFITSVGIEFNKLYNSQMRTEAELRTLHEELRMLGEGLRADTEAFKAATQADTAALKKEMQEFKEEMRRDRRDMNRKWGELANKMGTLVEDLVFPSLSRIVQELLQQPALDKMLRRDRTLADGRQKEYDALVVTADVVCINSTKTTLRSQDVDSFISELAEFREFYPEYRDYPFVGILATLNVNTSVLNYAEKMGFAVLSIGDELMEIQNSPGFLPKRW